jgi:hypothetical protein
LPTPTTGLQCHKLLWWQVHEPDAPELTAIQERQRRVGGQSLADGPSDPRETLGEIEERIEDLLPVVRNYVYYPEFNGGFGLKNVTPVLVPELSYEGLEVGGAGGCAATD